MKSDEFLERWNALPETKPLQRLERWQLYDLNLSESTIALLTEAGVPEDIFGFEIEVRSDAHIRIAVANWGVPEPIKEHLHRFVHLGFDGGGNPLCIAPEQSENVVLLDHEDNFYPQFVSSSWAQFMEFWLRVQELEAETNVWDTPDDEEKILALQQRLYDELRRIDPDALGQTKWLDGWYLADYPEWFR